MFSAVAEQIGVDHDTAARLAAGFGGGMYLGSACGAVTGGIMAIGAKYGGQTAAAQMQTARLVRDFAGRFKAQHRSINCPDLLGGVDLSQVDPLGHPEKMQALLESKLFAPCPGYVRDAAAIVNDLVTAVPVRAAR